MLRTQTARAGAAPATKDVPNWSRVAALAAGDLIIFLVFTIQGLSTHGETITAAAVIATAAPFIISWFVIAPFVGAFGRRGSAPSTRPAPLVQQAAISWLVAWAVALLLRYAVFHGGITPAFAIVALLFNGVLLLGWRAAISYALWRS